MRQLQPYLAMQTIEDVWAHHIEVMTGFGFDRLFYAFPALATHPGGMVAPNDALFLTNHGAGYVDDYVHSGLYRDGPLMNWATQNIGATSWRVVRDQAAAEGLSEGGRRVAAINQKYGLEAGYTISFPMAFRNSNAGFGLCARKGLSQDDVDEIWAEHGDEIQVINHVAHLCILQLPAPHQGQMLTERQVEALELVADGKSTQDIAVIWGRNIATVEKHLRGARDGLGVETTAQAVRKASILNQIFSAPTPASRKPSTESSIPVTAQ